MKRLTIGRAAKAGNIRAIRRRLRLGIDVNEIKEGGSTPLQMAVRAGQVLAVKYLLEHDADPNLGSRSPLLSAVTRNDLAITLLLLAHGAHPTRDMIIRMAAKGDSIILYELLVHGGDPNSVDEHNHSALHLAARSGRLDACHCLVEAGAGVNARTPDGQTPLHEARKNHHGGVEKYLLSVGAIE